MLVFFFLYVVLNECGFPDFNFTAKVLLDLVKCLLYPVVVLPLRMSCGFWRIIRFLAAEVTVDWTRKPKART